MAQAADRGLVSGNWGDRSDSQMETFDSYNHWTVRWAALEKEGILVNDH